MAYGKNMSYGSAKSLGGKMFRGGVCSSGKAGVGAQVRGGVNDGKGAGVAKTSGSAVGVTSGKKMPQPHSPIGRS